jgi:hypothetical protein
MHLVAMAAIATALGTQPLRAQPSASAVVSATILSPVGVSENEAMAIDPMTAPTRGQASSGLSGSFALDGSAERTVSVSSVASLLSGSDLVSLNVRASRTRSGFDLTGGAVAHAGAAPGLYAGAVAVVVNYN